MTAEAPPEPVGPVEPEGVPDLPEPTSKVVEELAALPALPTAEETLPVLDINHATATEWERLPGWGKVLSKRTVKFREALGGFVSIEQLKLVYGLDPDVVERNRTHLRVQQGGQARMCLDTLSFRTLVGHPLFDADQTRRVLRARGRVLSSMDVFWERLSPDSTERATWEPYLDTCHGQ